MRVPEEKREPYAVHFVSANKHATVLSRICRTTYTIRHKISQIVRFFFLFLQISENMLNFWRGVSIVSSFFYKKSKQARVTTFVRLFLDGATIVKGPGCAEGTHLVSAILR